MKKYNNPEIEILSLVADDVLSGSPQITGENDTPAERLI